MAGDKARKRRRWETPVQSKSFKGTNLPNSNMEREIEQPNYNLTGALERDNAIRFAKKNGKKVKKIRKHSLPPDGALPTEKWRLYVFDSEKEECVMSIFNRKAYLLGRKKKIADIHLDHISASNEHAAIQFRSVEMKAKAVDGVLDIKYGTEEHVVNPYLIDLKSTNGTYLNGSRISDSRYYELRDSDVIKFGVCTKEYVIMKGTALSKEEEEEQEGKSKKRSKGGVFGL